MTKTSPPREKSGLAVLRPDDVFRFECHSGLDCFTRCCRDITIFLTPYDILRMKNALRISSGEFLSQYTLSLIGDLGLPVVVLKMGADEEKSCPFLESGGCRLYPDRPWACRVYPLQPERTRLTEKAGKSFYSAMDVPFCRGLQSNRSQSVSEWIEEQGIPEYLKMEAAFKKITDNERLGQERITNPKIREMVYMACYDLDRFRRFVLESTFLERFEVSPATAEAVKTDDVALYGLAIQWLEYGLLAQQVLEVRPDVMAAKKQQMGVE